MFQVFLANLLFSSLPAFVSHRFHVSLLHPFLPLLSHPPRSFVPSSPSRAVGSHPEKIRINYSFIVHSVRIFLTWRAFPPIKVNCTIIAVLLCFLAALAFIRLALQKFRLTCLGAPQYSVTDCFDCLSEHHSQTYSCDIIFWSVLLWYHVRNTLRKVV